jgi:hypothetical protein
MIEAIDDSLASFGVHATFPHKRRELASSLASEGVTSDQVDRLGAYCERTIDPPGVPKVLVTLLAKGRRHEALADLERCEQLRAQRKKTYPGAGQFKQAERTEDWLDMVCFVRTMRENADSEKVAVELDISPREVEERAAREAARRGASGSSSTAPKVDRRRVRGRETAGTPTATPDQPPSPSQG